MSNFAHRYVGSRPEGEKNMGKTGDFVIRFGKWRGEPLSEIPVDSIWWLTQTPGLWKSTKDALRAHLEWLWYNPDQAWMAWGKYDGYLLGEIPTWWLQLQMDFIDAVSMKSPCLRHLMQKELHRRGTDNGVMELRSDGTWYEKIPLDEREDNFSPSGDYTTESDGGSRRWPSLWYGAKVKCHIAADYDIPARSKDERKTWSVIMQKPNSHTGAALQKALSYQGCGCTKRCAASCECGCHAAWNRWRRMKDRKDVVETWMATLAALEVSCNRDETLLEQYIIACGFIANVVQEHSDEDRERAASDLLDILRENYTRELQREEARECLACDQWHEAREEEDDADDDEASPKKLSERRQQQHRSKEEVCDEARDFIEDLRRQKKARLKKLKYQRRYAQRTEHAQEVLEEARNSIGGAWACRVCIGDTEGVRLCE